MCCLDNWSPILAAVTPSHSATCHQHAATVSPWQPVAIVKPFTLFNCATCDFNAAIVSFKITNALSGHFLQYRTVQNAINMLQPCRPDNQCFIITFSTPSHCATCDLDAAIVLPLQPVRHPGIFYTIALSTTQTCCNRLVLTTNAPPCHSKFVFLRNLKANPYSHYITLQHKTHPIVSPWQLVRHRAAVLWCGYVTKRPIHRSTIPLCNMHTFLMCRPDNYCATESLLIYIDTLFVNQSIEPPFHLAT